MTVPRKPTSQQLLEDQRLGIDALERWFQFVNGEREIDELNFGDELLFPTAWARRFRRAGYSVRTPPSIADVEDIRVEIEHGLRLLADGHDWVINGAELQDCDIVITPIGIAHEGTVKALSLLGIAGLLSGEEWRAGDCAWCGKLFLKKKRGEYCSKRCSQALRTFKTRNKALTSYRKPGRKPGTLVRMKLWELRCKQAKEAGLPIAKLVRQERGITERFITTCPVCRHEFESPELWTTVQCAECKSADRKSFFVAGPLNSKPAGGKE